MTTICGVPVIGCGSTLTEAEKTSAKPLSVPVVYFTQLLALALGHDVQKLGFEKNFVDPLPVLRRRGVV
jgi:heterodisulfide reductase subunit B